MVELELELIKLLQQEVQVVAEQEKDLQEDLETLLMEQIIEVVAVAVVIIVVQKKVALEDQV